MAQAGALPVTFDGSQTRVGGQTPDPIVAPDSQTPRTQPAAAELLVWIVWSFRI